MLSISGGCAIMQPYNCPVPCSRFSLSYARALMLAEQLTIGKLAILGIL